MIKKFYYTKESAIYTVTYNSNGATSGTVPASQSYEYGNTVTVSGNSGSLTKTGYSFSGWNTSADGTGTSYDPGDTFNISGNTTLYALWASTISYTITVLADPVAGGSVSGGGTYSPGATAQISTVPNAGYNFVQWNDGWRELTRNITVTESKTYTALYTNAEPPFTVTFDLNGHGSGSAPAALILDSTTGYYATKPTNPTDSNYTFTGWYTVQSGGALWSFVGDKVVKDTTLYAQWVQKHFISDVALEADSGIPGRKYSGDPANPKGTQLTGKWAWRYEEDLIINDTPELYMNQSSGTHALSGYEFSPSQVFAIYEIDTTGYECIGISVNSGSLIPFEGTRICNLKFNPGVLCKYCNIEVPLNITSISICSIWLATI